MYNLTKHHPKFLTTRAAATSTSTTTTTTAMPPVGVLGQQTMSCIYMVLSKNDAWCDSCFLSQFQLEFACCTTCRQHCAPTAYKCSRICLRGLVLRCLCSLQSIHGLYFEISETQCCFRGTGKGGCGMHLM